MRPGRPIARPRPVLLLLLLAGVALLGVVPAAAEGPLRLVDVSPSDQHVTVVADVPGSQAAGTPPPEFQVLDGESRLPVEAEPVLQPRRSFTLVVDAAGAGSATTLEELKRAATDLLLRLGTTVEPALVVSRATAPDVLPPGGVVAAVAVVEDLRLGARSKDALVPAVRAAAASGGGTSGPGVVLVLAASEGAVPPAQLREELSGQQALLHTLAVRGTAQQYWREVVPGSAEELFADGSGPGTGAVVQRLASQHVVSFRKPRSEGSVQLNARTRESLLTATISLGSGRAPAGEQATGSDRGAWVLVAVLLLAAVVGGLLVRGRRDRDDGTPRGPRPGATPTARQRLERPCTPSTTSPGEGRHHRGVRGGPPQAESHAGRGATSALAAPGHAAPPGTRGPAAAATGHRAAGARSEHDVPRRVDGKHVRGREDVPSVCGPGELPAVSGSDGGADPAPSPATPRATAPASSTGSSEAASRSPSPSPSPARWVTPPAVPQQRRSAPASETGRTAPPDSAPPDSAPPTDGGPDQA